MPRVARQKSLTGIYHVIFRGSNKQDIFLDDKDRIKFIDTLRRYKNSTGIKVLGWCLMNNHVHLLLEEGSEDLSNTIKRIGVSYVSYFNLKYDKVGHLFQDRFRSENIESDDYLLTVIRYIHQNPLKAGLVTKSEKWEWSSCADYYGIRKDYDNLLDKTLILGLFSENLGLSIARFKEFNEAINMDICLEDNKKTKLSDAEARALIEKTIPDINISLIKNLPNATRNSLILKIKGIEGITQRQIARIIDISPGKVFRA